MNAYPFVVVGPHGYVQGSYTRREDADAHAAAGAALEVLSGEAFAALLAEARGWIADVQTSYDYDDARDIVNHWPPQRVAAAVERHYEGGWRAFRDASAALV